jgi:hypothetical protein
MNHEQIAANVLTLIKVQTEDNMTNTAKKPSTLQHIHKVLYALWSIQSSYLG